jgi:hypothetical protein
MKNEFFMHDLHEQKTGKDFRANKSPEDIKSLMSGLGYEQISENIAFRLSLLSVAFERRNSHFQDAMEIAEIIDNLVPDELSDNEVNELRAVSLVHDIGKTGPAGSTEEEQLAFMTMFNLDFEYGKEHNGFMPGELSIEKALALKVEEGEVGAERAEEIKDMIDSASVKQGRVTAETKVSRKTLMRDFWSAHVYWTYDVLKGEENLSENFVNTAASHHLLDGHDPARIGFEGITSEMAALEMADKYQAYRIRLMLADRYQAYRRRGARTHEETIVIMRERLNEQFEAPEGGLIDVKARQIFEQVLDLIDSHKELFEKEMDLEI